MLTPQLQAMSYSSSQPQPHNEHIQILRGEIQGLRLECEHSAREQGARIGTLEQQRQSQEDRMEMLRSRVERLDSDMRVSQARLSTIWGAATGIVVIVELFRLLANVL